MRKLTYTAPGKGRPFFRYPSPYPTSDRLYSSAAAPATTTSPGPGGGHCAARQAVSLSSRYRQDHYAPQNRFYRFGSPPHLKLSFAPSQNPNNKKPGSFPGFLLLSLHSLLNRCNDILVHALTHGSSSGFDLILFTFSHGNRNSVKVCCIPFAVPVFAGLCIFLWRHSNTTFLLLSVSCQQTLNK